ncbi:SOS response-associated peptidase [Miniphocaeibacter massiliensis]|uniref:SOS response-associated peptidase n=1 Tax=Miniphocaeibacter massiliensis TaxID=2041841 RepID=UPI000C086ABC|nr:SOS response-associated peptidase family protein [Miniphocaeibacter massiliensis]
MCGRFGLESNIYELLERYRFLEKGTSIKSESEVFYPSDKVTVIIGNKLHKLSWGIKTSENSKLIINSRIENIINKKYFCEDFKSRRCIIPANYFFEWDKIKIGNSKYKIYDINNDIFSFAGIYRRVVDNKNNYEFISLLTRESEGEIAKIHKRMPIIIPKNYEKDYLIEGNFDVVIRNIMKFRPNLDLKLVSDSQLSFI